MYADLSTENMRLTAENQQIEDQKSQMQRKLEGKDLTFRREDKIRELNKRGPRRKATGFGKKLGDNGAK